MYTKEELSAPVLHRVKSSGFAYKTRIKDDRNRKLYSDLSREGLTDFYDYLDWLDLAGVNTIVLSSVHHYYFTKRDFDKTQLLLNLKNLMDIKDQRSFLNKLYLHLPDFGYFAGYFRDPAQREDLINEYLKFPIPETEDEGNNTQNSFLETPLLNKITRFFDSGFYPLLTKKRASSLLKETGFTVLDMTDLDGSTYFCVQKRPAPFNF